MIRLLSASLVWAFSFGLIKHVLVAVGLAPSFVAFVRLALSFLVFLPFVRFVGLRRTDVLRFAGIGALQYGVMYIAYLASYAFLAAHEVALFTIFTPLYVALADDVLERRWRPRVLASAAAAVVGTAVIVWTRAERAAAIEGILLLQVANLCFAAGQVLYRRVMGRVVLTAERDGLPAVTDHGVFAVLYLGAAGVALVPAVVSGIGVDAKIGMAQVVTLLYLGIVPSACCFYLWNAGARRVPAGALAAMNNAKLPLAVLVSLVFFGESANLTRLVAGGAVLLAAVWLGARGPVSRREPV